MISCSDIICGMYAMDVAARTRELGGCKPIDKHYDGSMLIHPGNVTVFNIVTKNIVNKLCHVLLCGTQGCCD